MKRDLASKYEEYQKQINKLEDLQIQLMQYCGFYKIPFGKYKDMSLYEIAYKDRRYFEWLLAKDLLPFTMNLKMKIHVMTYIQEHKEFEQVKQEHEMLEKQGYRGRYII